MLILFRCCLFSFRKISSWTRERLKNDGLHNRRQPVQMRMVIGCGYGHLCGRWARKLLPRGSILKIPTLLERTKHTWDVASRAETHYPTDWMLHRDRMDIYRNLPPIIWKFVSSQLHIDEHCWTLVSATLFLYQYNLAYSVHLIIIWNGKSISYYYLLNPCFEIYISPYLFPNLLPE